MSNENQDRRLRARELSVRHDLNAHAIARKEGEVTSQQLRMELAHLEANNACEESKPPNVVCESICSMRTEVELLKERISCENALIAELERESRYLLRPPLRGLRSS